MVRERRGMGRVAAGVAAGGMVLGVASTALALQPLPPGGQVNSDVAAGIDPARSVSGEDPANADVTGGALTAGKVAVPWAVFRQLTTGTDQVFSRSFAGGAWTTRGAGTVGGRSSASPTFAGSLNFDQTQDGEAPAIDFAGTGRTVPWSTWYENTTGIGFGTNNVFASRFDSTTGKWIFAGQGRTNGGSGPEVPSLNLHTDQDAENPSVAGGSAVAGNAPGPWVTWQETGAHAPGLGKDQIFVEKPLGPGRTDCLGVTPASDLPANPPVGGFCWQQVGVQRLGAGPSDPSLNVDRTRDGVEPDIAFTGTNDTVPWVVWYELGASGDALHNNEMVFAAKAVPGAGDGGFSWTSVGSGAQGALDATAHGGSCGTSQANEAACSLNANAAADAEDPRVAAGTMTPGSATVPWVVWDETVSGVPQVFVSRLTGTGAAARFQLANGGQPVSTGSGATRPDITFSGNTPYVTWRQTVGATQVGFVGHLVNAANPTFVLDASNIPLTPTAQADVREPISAGCTANPFNADGANCQGGAQGTPFFLFTNGTSPLGLFADAYSPAGLTTGAASGVTASGATLTGTLDPQGAALGVGFEFGTTTAYGQTTSLSHVAVANGATPFSAAVSGLPAHTLVHYRAIAVTDFGTFVGADRTLTTKSAVTVGKVKVRGTKVTVAVTCNGTTTCRLKLRLTTRIGKRSVLVGSAKGKVKAGRTKHLSVSLNHKGRALLSKQHRLKAKLTVYDKQGKKYKAIAHKTVVFKS